MCIVACRSTTTTGRSSETLQTRLHPLIIGRYNDVAERDTAQRFRDDIPSREYRCSRLVLIV